MNEYWDSGRIGRMCLKELRESLRDRRTIMTLILMPLLVYPLLSMALQRLLISSAPKNQAKVYQIGVSDSEQAEKLQGLFDLAQTAIASGLQPNIREIRTPVKPVEIEPKSNSAESQVFESNNATGEIDQFEIGQLTDLSASEALKRGVIDIAITKLEVIKGLNRRGDVNNYLVELEFVQGDLRGEGAAKAWRKMCQYVNDFQFEGLRASINPKLQPAVSIVTRGIGAPVDPTASLAGVIPLVLILMTITGAVYPAIDLTAGERERGTMEAMIATPAPRFSLLLSKYVAVVTVAIMTALANLLATWATLSFGGLGNAILGAKGFSISTLIQILPILAIFACFFSSILLALCSFAKSFKEAQAYLIPVMLISLAPGLVTLLPNVEFTVTKSVIPLLNVLLLSRDIMVGQPPLVPSFLAVLTTIIYGAASLAMASSLFGRANSALSSQATWSDLLRRPTKMTNLPNLGHLAMYLALLFPTIFVLSNWSASFGFSTSTYMGLNALLLVLLFGVLPFGLLWHQRVRIGSTFQFRLGFEQCSNKDRLCGTALVMLSTILMTTSLWIVAVEFVVLFRSWSMVDKLSNLEDAKAKFLAVPFFWVLLTQAVVPAISEELFFRGFALGAMRERFSAWRCVLYNALLFGLFHIVTGPILSPERFAPTFLLGVCLSILALASRSIWPGIALHAAHNGLVLWFSTLEKDQLSPWFGESEHVPVGWLLTAITVVGTAFFLLYLVTKIPKKR